MDESEGLDVLDILFAGLEDPRIDRSKIYSLKEIFFLVLVACLAGVDTWRGMELFGNARLELLRKFLPFEGGIPSHQTIGRVFSLIRPSAFEKSFIEFMRSVQKSSEGEIIAIDGKAVRGSRTGGHEILYLVNAWAVKNGLTLGQLAIPNKTNEIIAVPLLLQKLNIKGATVTADAMNCQRETATEIVKGDADYVLAVKGNQPKLHAAIQEHFEHEPVVESAATFYETTDKGHGRIEHRRYYADTAGSWLPDLEHWAKVKSVGMVISDVFRGEKPSSEVRFFITSFEPDAKRLAEAVRGHWAVENSLHWVLDVTFGEDASTVRKDHAPRNFATVRKIALNMLKADKRPGSLKGKRMKALMMPDYLEVLMKQAGL